MDVKTATTEAEQLGELAAIATGHPEAIAVLQLAAALIQSTAGAVQVLIAAYQSNDPDVLGVTLAKVQHANDVLMGNVDVPALEVVEEKHPELPLEAAPVVEEPAPSAVEEPAPAPPEAAANTDEVNGSDGLFE